jgi:hypothetical protein
VLPEEAMRCHQWKAFSLNEFRSSHMACTFIPDALVLFCAFSRTFQFSFLISQIRILGMDMALPLNYIVLAVPIIRMALQGVMSQSSLHLSMAKYFDGLF